MKLPFGDCLPCSDPKAAVETCTVQNISIRSTAWEIWQDGGHIYMTFIGQSRRVRWGLSPTAPTSNSWSGRRPSSTTRLETYESSTTKLQKHACAEQQSRNRTVNLVEYLPVYVLCPQLGLKLLKGGMQTGTQISVVLQNIVWKKLSVANAGYGGVCWGPGLTAPINQVFQDCEESSLMFACTQQQRLWPDIFGRTVASLVYCDLYLYMSSVLCLPSDCAKQHAKRNTGFRCWQTQLERLPMALRWVRGGVCQGHGPTAPTNKVFPLCVESLMNQSLRYTNVWHTTSNFDMELAYKTVQCHPCSNIYLSMSSNSIAVLSPMRNTLTGMPASVAKK